DNEEVVSQSGATAASTVRAVAHLDRHRNGIGWRRGRHRVWPTDDAATVDAHAVGMLWQAPSEWAALGVEGSHGVNIELALLGLRRWWRRQNYRRPNNRIDLDGEGLQGGRSGLVDDANGKILGTDLLGVGRPAQGAAPRVERYAGRRALQAVAQRSVG